MSDDAANCHESLRILADKTRFAILQRLMKSPCHVGEINEAVQIEQSLLSHHLKILREGGLVVSKRDGKAVLYEVAPGTKIDDEGSIDLGCCRLTFGS